VILLLRMLARDWRGGEMLLLMSALVLAVTMVAGISGFAGSLQAALRTESNTFLAADLVVAGSRPLAPAVVREAGSGGALTAPTMTFSSMAFAGDEMVLASVKAVGDAYPLRGSLSLSDTPYGESRAHVGAPRPGSAWIDPRLFALLNVAVGDRIEVGEASFTVTAALRGEPDRSGGFLGVGPRVMLNIADIPATGIVRPGSRVSYRQLFAADADLLPVLRARLEALLGDGQRLLDVDTAQPSVARALRRAERFLLLGGSLAVILAGVAISLAARRFAERHQAQVALLKSLGMSRPAIRRLYAGHLLINGVLATMIGWLLARGAQALAASRLAEMLDAPVAGFGPRPYIVGAVTALVCLTFFAWPPLARLAAASPLRVLRSDLPLHSSREYLDYLAGLCAVSLLMWWYSGDLRLTAVVLAGLLMLVVSGALFAWLALRGGRRLGMQAGSEWRLALASLQRHGVANALQVVVFGISLMLLLLLVLLRASLLDDWQQQLPERAPNHFLLNIAPEELEAVRERLDAEGLARERLYPMLRGRVVGVAGEPLAARDAESAQPDGPRQREANFTWSAQLPDGNRLIEGAWWSADGAAEVSVEVEFAQRLGMRPGDELDLLIGAESLRVRVASLRELDWQSFKPNFFMVFPPGLLERYPATWMTSFYLPPQRKAFLNTLLRAHPTVTVIEVDAIMEQLRLTLQRVSAAIEIILLLVLVTGLLVLVAGIQSSLDLRLREGALLRALGAGQRRIAGSLAIEFAALGALAGTLAMVAAEGAFWALQRFVFEIAWQPSPALWPVAVALAAVLIALLGLWSCRRVIRVAPVAVLRDL
jgi:putative ABC transport system permease protein